MSRTKRLEKFKIFYQEANDIFETFAKNDNYCKIFKLLSPFRVVPGGKDGGLDQNRIEIFFGHRPIDSEKTIDKSHRLCKKQTIEAGATLCYQKTVTGCVICTLQPAKTKSFNPLEDIILIDFLSSPSKLSRWKLKQHWKFFIAYMDVTRVEDITSYKHKLYVWYLKIFKETFSEGKSKGRKFFVFMSNIMKQTLTISFSGFVLFMISLIDNSTEKNRGQILESLKIINQNIVMAQKEIDKNVNIQNARLQNISSELVKINTNISKLLNIEKKYQTKNQEKRQKNQSQQ